MTHFEQLIAMLKSSGTCYSVYEWTRGDITEKSVILTQDTEETWLNFSVITGQLISVEVTSFHYSD